MTTKALRDALEEAKLQLAYLDERFHTGSTPAVMARIDAALAQPSPASSTAGGRTMDGLRKERDRALFCMMDEAQRHLVALSRLQEAQSIAACMYHRDNCTSSPDHPGMCGCGLEQLNRALTLPADHIEDAHGKVSGEPASVAGEADTELVARIIAEGNHGDPWWWHSTFDDGQDKIAARLRDDDKAIADRILAELSKPTPADTSPLNTKPVDDGCQQALREYINGLRNRYQIDALDTGLGRKERTRCSHYVQVLDELSAALSATPPSREGEGA